MLHCSGSAGHVSVLSVFIALQIRRRHLPDRVGGHHQAQSVRAGGAGNSGQRRHGAAGGTQSALGLSHIAQVQYGPYRTGAIWASRGLAEATTQ